MVVLHAEVVENKLHSFIMFKYMILFKLVNGIDEILGL